MALSVVALVIASYTVSIRWVCKQPPAGSLFFHNFNTCLPVDASSFLSLYLSSLSPTNYNLSKLLPTIRPQKPCLTALLFRALQGWPVFRGASEWKNSRNFFVDIGDYVWTSGSLFPGNTSSFPITRLPFFPSPQHRASTISLLFPGRQLHHTSRKRNACRPEPRYLSW